MSGYQKYVVIDEFTLNATKNSITKTLTMKRGDVLEFDGVNVYIGGEDQGMAPSLRKVVGEWVEKYNGSDAFLAKLQEKIRGKFVKPQDLRRVVLNASVENSNPQADSSTVTSTVVKVEELKALVNEPEPVKEVQRFTVVDDDQTVVGTVTRNPNEASARSSSSVEMGKDESSAKREIVSDTNLIIKETDYSEDKPVPTISESKISVEEDAVIETAYTTQERTDIGSSTQAQIVENPVVPPSQRRKEAKDTSKVKIIKDLSDDQEGVVVRKVSPIVLEEQIADIKSNLTVGGNTESTDGEATFSANNDISIGEATFGNSGEDTAMDFSAVVIDSDDGVDIQGLLDSL